LFATSAVSIDILKGHPYGGMGFLYKRDIAQFVTVVDNHDVWLTALILLSTHGPVLLVNVYMPTDYET